MGKPKGINRKNSPKALIGENDPQGLQINPVAFKNAILGACSDFMILMEIACAEAGAFDCQRCHSSACKCPPKFRPRGSVATEFLRERASSPLASAAKVALHSMVEKALKNLDAKLLHELADCVDRLKVVRDGGPVDSTGLNMMIAWEWASQEIGWKPPSWKTWKTKLRALVPNHSMKNPKLMAEAEKLDLKFSDLVLPEPKGT